MEQDIVNQKSTLKTADTPLGFQHHSVAVCQIRIKLTESFTANCDLIKIMNYLRPDPIFLENSFMHIDKPNFFDISKNAKRV